MGDVAMTVPVIKALAQQYPHVRITFLSKGFARAFFENLAPNVSFMEADIKEEYKGIKGLNKLFRRLHAKKFTAIADLHDVLRSEYLRLRFNMNLDKYKIAHIDKHRSARKKLCAQKNKELKQLPTSFENYAEVFAKLGYPININFTSQGEPPLLSTAVSPLLAEIEGRLNIGIAPFAAHQGKIYPIPMMEEVIKGIIQKHPDCRILLFGGGKKEKEVFDKWCSQYANCVNASAACKGLQQELGIMSHLQVMISMDSANMHLASLVNTPVVSIWGATHPYAGFMGWNQRYENAVQVELDCRPCSIYGNKPCLRGDYACLKNISPEQIISKVESLLLTSNNKEQ